MILHRRENGKKRERKSHLPFVFFVSSITRTGSTTQLHISPFKSVFLFLSLMPSPPHPLSLLHKCQLPYLRAFCTDLRVSLYRSYYKSLTPVTLLCWYSSAIFYFVSSVTECFGPGPRKGTLGLSRGLTGMKCELQQPGLTTAADPCNPASVSFCFPF